MEIVMLKRKIVITKIKNILEEFEMEERELELDAKIDPLKHTEKTTRKRTEEIKESTLEIKELEI